MPEFLKHAIVMLSGAVLGQAIPLIIAPILTRLYTPAQFGVFNSVVALAGIFSVIATLRFDLAIVLPKSKRSAANLAGLAFASAIFFCLSLWLLVLALYPWLSSLQIFQSLGVWWHAVPLLALAIAFQQTLSFFANREKQYRAIALGNVILQLAAALTGIGIGVLATSTSWINGLVIARVLGFAIGVAFLYFFLRRFWLQYRPLISLGGMRFAAAKHKKFPYFNVPYSLTGVFSREFLVLALTAASQLQAAGFYGFARLLLNAPINFLTAALSQVFYREAAINSGTDAFQRFVWRLMLVFAIGLTPIFALAAFWAEPGFSLLFGDKWSQSGQFAAMLMPIALLSVFTSWPERIFEVKNKQHWALIIQLSFDSASIIGVIWMLSLQFNVSSVVAFYVGVQLVYQFVYLFTVFHLVGLKPGQYLTIIAIISINALLVFSLHGSTVLFSNQIGRFIIESLLVALFSVTAGLLAKRKLGARFKGVG